jgi:Meckel syndrome type 1 protein
VKVSALAAVLLSLAAPAMAQDPDLLRVESAEGVAGIKDAIHERWNRPMLERIPNFEDLVITMRITLDRQGMIVGEPEMIRPVVTSDPRFAVAEHAAASALIRAQPYDLPADKFARWQVIEVTFNPRLGESK